jgi:hypothetical protein
MRQRIAALEEAIARLPSAGAEPLEPRPLDDGEIEEINTTLAKLRTQPPSPAERPTDAVEAQSKLRRSGEKVLTGSGRGCSKAGDHCSIKDALGELW